MLRASLMSLMSLRREGIVRVFSPATGDEAGSAETERKRLRARASYKKEEDLCVRDRCVVLLVFGVQFRGELEQEHSDLPPTFGRIFSTGNSAFLIQSDGKCSATAAKSMTLFKICVIFAKFAERWKFCYRELYLQTARRPPCSRPLPRSEVASASCGSSD